MWPDRTDCIPLLPTVGGHQGVEHVTRGHMLHQLEPSWKGENARVGGGALEPDTTGSATPDCTTAMARAKGEASPETGAGVGQGGLPRQEGPEKAEETAAEWVQRHRVRQQEQADQWTTWQAGKEQEEQPG